MAFKLTIALALVSLTTAGVVPAQQYHAKQSEPQAESKYKFSYAINDEHTGDVKSQFESRDGDVVHGEYSLIDADGFKRVVHYTADPEHGFNAVVQREPLNYAVKPVTKAQIPVTHAAPVTAATLFKSAPSAYATAPTQATYVRQSEVKSASGAYNPAPAKASYDKQYLNKKTPATYSGQQAQSFTKAAPVVHASSPTQRSYEGQYFNKPAQGAYVSQAHGKSVPTSYRG